MESGFLNKIFLALEGRIPDINKKNVAALANSHRNMVNEWEDKIRNINLKSKLIRNDNLRLYQAMVISRDRCLIGYYSLLNSLAQIEFAQHQAGFMVGSLIGGLLIGIAAGWAVGPMLTAVVAMTDNIIILFITELTLNVVTGFLTSLIIGGIGKAAGAIDYDAKHILGDFVGNLVGGVFGFIGSKAIMTILNNNLGTGIIKGAIAKDVAGVTEKTAEEAGGKASSVLSFMKSSGSLIGHTALGSANMFLYNTFNQKIVSGNWVNVSNEDWATDVFYNLVPGLALGMVSGFHNYKFGDKRDHHTIQEIEEKNDVGSDNNINTTAFSNNTNVELESNTGDHIDTHFVNPNDINIHNTSNNRDIFYGQTATHYAPYDINNNDTGSSSNSQSNRTTSAVNSNSNKTATVDNKNKTYNLFNKYHLINQRNNNNHVAVDNNSIKSNGSESSGASSSDHFVPPKDKIIDLNNVNDQLNNSISTVGEVKEDENIKPYTIDTLEIKDNLSKTHSVTINNDNNSSSIKRASFGIIGDTNNDNTNNVIDYDGIYNPNRYFKEQGVYSNNELIFNNIYGINNKDLPANSSIKNPNFITNIIQSDTNQLPIPPKVKNDNYVKVDYSNDITNNKSLPNIPPKVPLKILANNEKDVKLTHDKKSSFNQKNNNQNNININKNTHNIENNNRQQFLQDLSPSKKVVKEYSLISFNDNRNVKCMGYIESIDYKNSVVTIKYTDNSERYDNLKSINKTFDKLKEENRLNNIDIDFNHEDKPLPKLPLEDNTSNIYTIDNRSMNKFNTDNINEQIIKRDLTVPKSLNGKSNNNLLNVPNKPLNKRINIDNYFNSDKQITDNKRKENFTIGDIVIIHRRGGDIEGKVVAYPNNVAELSIKTKDGYVSNINYGYIENITRKNMSNITVTNYDNIQDSSYIKNNTSNIQSEGSYSKHENNYLNINTNNHKLDYSTNQLDSNMINNNFNEIREEKFTIGDEVSHWHGKLKYKGKVLGFSDNDDKNIIVGFGKDFNIPGDINYKELQNITKENQYNKQNFNKILSSNSDNQLGNSSILKGKAASDKVINHSLVANIDDRTRREKFKEDDIISYTFNGKLFRGYVIGYSNKSLSHVSVNLFDESSDNLVKMDVHHAQLTKIIEPSNDKEINKTDFNINLTSNNTNVHNLATDNNIIDTQRDNNSQYINKRVFYTPIHGERKEGTIIGFAKDKTHISRVKFDGYTKASLININKLKILNNKDNTTLISNNIDRDSKSHVSNNDNKTIKNNDVNFNIFIGDSVNIELNDNIRRTNFKQGDNVSYFDGDKIINGKIAGYSNDDYKCNLNVELRDNNNFTSTKEIDYRFVNKLTDDTNLSHQLFKKDDNVVFYNKHYGTVIGIDKARDTVKCRFVGRNGGIQERDISIYHNELKHNNKINVNNVHNENNNNRLFNINDNILFCNQYHGTVKSKVDNKLICEFVGRNNTKIKEIDINDKRLQHDDNIKINNNPQNNYNNHKPLKSNIKNNDLVNHNNINNHNINNNLNNNRDSVIKNNVDKSKGIFNKFNKSSINIFNHKNNSKNNQLKILNNISTDFLARSIKFEYPNSKSITYREGDIINFANLKNNNEIVKGTLSGIVYGKDGKEDIAWIKYINNKTKQEDSITVSFNDLHAYNQHLLEK